MRVVKASQCMPASVEARRSRCGLGVASFGQTCELTQIMGYDFKAAGSHPALRLLVNHLPDRQVIRHQPPLGASTHDIAQGDEEFAQRILPLGRILPHQQQVRLAKPPLFVSDITGINSSWLIGRRLHPKRMA